MLHAKYVGSKHEIPTQKKLRELLLKVFPIGRIVPQHTEYEHFYKDTVDGEVYPSVTTKIGVYNKPYLKQWAANQAVDYIVKWMTSQPAIDKSALLSVLNEAKTAHKRTLETASIWGSDGHNLVDMYVDMWIREGKPSTMMCDLFSHDITNHGKCAALGAEKFFNEHTLFPIATEMKIVSKKHRYGGTLDSLWLIGEVRKGRVGDELCEHEWLETAKGGKVVCSKCHREEDLSIALIDLKTSNQVLDITYAWQVSAYAMALKEMTGIKCHKHWIVQLDKDRPRYTLATLTDVKESFSGFLSVSELHEHNRRYKDTAVQLVNQKKVIIL